MFSRVISGTVQGIDAVMIQVEADMSDGLPAFVMVGYLSSCVREAAERVRTALRNSGVSVPPRRITVNLSPADIRKDGTAFDLPIAVCILISMGIISEEAIKNTMIIGELGLNGDINGVPGVLSMVHYASEHGINRFIVPRANMEEAGLIKGIEVIAVSGLQELIDYECNGRKVIHDMNKSTGYYPDDCYDLGDFADIKGQVMLKRGVEIAVAGLHNIMMTGAAGSGKTMIARRIPTIMPKLTFDESIEVTKIYSVAGMLKNGRGLITKRPFRAPHHTISTTALVGGGVIPGPGEISLADHGVLFLDEFPEFGRNVLETLRQPLEDREVNISRLSGRYRFPADFMLVTARNNCPCGGWPNANKCTCTYKQIRNYNARISGPLLDRIDINVDVVRVDVEELFDHRDNEPSETIRKRVMAAQEIQQERYRHEKIKFNSGLDGGLINKYIKINGDVRDILREMYEKSQLSARGNNRILKIARTIADLAGDTDIQEKHVREAIFYRMKEDGV